MNPPVRGTGPFLPCTEALLEEAAADLFPYRRGNAAASPPPLLPCAGGCRLSLPVCHPARKKERGRVCAHPPGETHGYSQRGLCSVPKGMDTSKSHQRAGTRCRAAQQAVTPSASNAGMKEEAPGLCWDRGNPLGWGSEGWVMPSPLMNPCCADCCARGVPEPCRVHCHPSLSSSPPFLALQGVPVAVAAAAGETQGLSRARSSLSASQAAGMRTEIPEP